jgi:hypothetical protein
MHVERSAVGLFPVELCDGMIALRIEAHFHESETFGLTASTIVNDRHAPNLPVRFEQRSNLKFGGLEREVPHENNFHLDILSTSDREDRGRIG